ncbi:GntR family transcriptional regulator [Rhizobium sp. AG855]|uniref:GntR family transcriptional regulator n=1 Tax=Rhizobium sp. AG855 TaxID=2183898 RepID=UPI000FF2F85A|nr:GntR family transcriptional regulator [Rhizobium sp. AG855]RKE77427.1 DNA-binding GntR family transcriptional regulator [Rhizobium sp. AG855]
MKQSQPLVGKETIADRVYNSIRKDLMECRWPAGYTLKIRNLAAEFGVSPMPVRLALKRLGDEGALTVEENRSARVPIISQRRFSEFFEITVRLETLALEKAFKSITAPQLDKLISEAEDIQRAIDEGHTTGYAQRFNAILMELYRIGGSSALIEMIEYVWVNVAPPSNAIFEAPIFVGKIHAHLLAVLLALRAKDLQSAEDALVAALSYAERAMNLLMDMDRTPAPTRGRRRKSQRADDDNEVSVQE